MSGATGAIASQAVIADRTVTFAAPKVGLVQYPGAGMVGDARLDRRAVEQGPARRDGRKIFQWP